jgi:predicted nucleic acid-binding protein
MIILDTNVISEQMRPQPDERVKLWLDSVDQAEVMTTSITVAELRFGAARLPQGKRRAALESWIDKLLSDAYHDRIEDFDLAAAEAYGSVRAGQYRLGRTIPFQDAQIAGICISRGAALATRNTDDFEGLGIRLINPWKL